MNITKRFSEMTRWTANLLGAPSATVIACLSILTWIILGPFFGFSDTWQLVINSITNIVTFIMVFLIQNTQNRDGEAVQIKLDELIRSHKGAHNALLDLEELTQEQIEHIKRKYEKLAKIARTELSHGAVDTKTSKV